MSKSVSLGAIHVRNLASSNQAIGSIRIELAGLGVPKGTISKACRIVEALRSGVLEPWDVKSVGSAYSAILDIDKMARVIELAKSTLKLSEAKLDSLTDILVGEWGIGG